MAVGHIPFVVEPPCAVRIPSLKAGTSSHLFDGLHHVRMAAWLVGAVVILASSALALLTAEPHLKMIVLMLTVVVPTVTAPLSTMLVTTVLATLSVSSGVIVLVTSVNTTFTGVAAAVALFGLVIVPVVAIRLLCRYVHRALLLERTRNGEDPMTGLLNRRGFARRVSALVAEVRADEIWVGVLLLDIDGFKRFNDKHGHMAGDQAIIASAKSITATPVDEVAVCRYGGEEFLVFGLIDDEADFGRLRAMFSDAVSRNLPVTLSIGGACARLVRSESHAALPLFDAVDRLIDSADRCTYQAKASLLLR